MKIGDRVKYMVGGKEHYGRIIWFSADGINAVVETDQGTRDSLPKSKLEVIND